MIQGADIPLYVQLKNWVKLQLDSGELRPYDPLPGERHLVAAHKLSRTTVRQALNELVAEGVLFRRHGKGTFVAPPRYEHSQGQLVGFAEELSRTGLHPVVRVLEARMQPATPEVVSMLHVRPDEAVAYIERLVSVHEAPLFIHRIYLIAQLGAFVLHADLAVETIYSIIESRGYPIREGMQTISAVSLSAADAHLLHAVAGEPALKVARQTYVDADSPVEYSEAIYCADRYQYHMRLRR